MKVFITRYGDVEEPRGIQDKWEQNEPQLSKIWYIQSELLAKRLKSEIFDAVFVSPFNRSQDTAVQIIMENPHPFVPVILPELSIESVDDLQVLEVNENRLVDPNWREHFLMDEEKSVWGKIKEQARGKEDVNILVVWHVGSNKALVAAILWYSDMNNIKEQEPTALSIFDVPQVWPVQIITENDTSHLGWMITESIADL